MRVAARLGAVALVFVAIAAFAGFAHPHPGEGRPSASNVAPMAALDIGELFGNENEADENEADEGSPQGAAAKDQGGGGGVPVPVVLVLVALAGALGGYVYIRVRRVYLRFRAWGRRMWARL
jgi:hypothetical protein